MRAIGSKYTVLVCTFFDYHSGGGTELDATEATRAWLKKKPSIFTVIHANSMIVAILHVP